MGNDNQSALKSLSELEGIFLVPAYQRGYRWGDSQIETMLDDINKAAAQDANGSYFLQAIVVKKRGERNGKPIWELIDGQQRLTTAWLVNGALHKRYPEDRELDFSLEYESRPGSAEFLNHLPESSSAPGDADNNIDFWHMARAIDKIRNWIQRIKKPAVYYEFFRENVRILWHEDGEDVDAASHFVSLNSGRIPLRDAELCRAAMLAGKNMRVDGELPPAAEGDAKERLKSHIIRNHQILMGSAWDRIERELREKPFWGFLNGPGDFPVHMDYLLQIIYDKNEYSGQHPCFHAIEEKLRSDENPTDSIAIWDEISFEFDRLAGWFQDDNYYHWLGYLSALRAQRNAPQFWREELTEAGGEPEKNFKEKVFNAIRKTISPAGDAPDLDAFLYGQPETKNLLLLFNVEYARRDVALGARFPFHKHNQLKWSLEHINAQKINLPSDQSVWRAWLELHKNYFDSSTTEDGEAIAKEIGKLIKKDRVTDEEFEPLRQRIEEYVGSPTIKQDTIFNLVLLDVSGNAALSNAIFVAKNDRIKSWLAFGEDSENADGGAFYAPMGTRAVLMRHFTDGSSDKPIWSQEDMDGYRKVLINILSFYWPALKLVYRRKSA